MKKKSITSNYIYNLSYQMLVVLVPLLATPYLTRILGADELGIYSFSYSIATVFFLFAALGINTYGQREIAYVQDNTAKRSKVFWELVEIRVISTLLSVLLLYIFSIITPRYTLYYQIFMIYVFSNLFDITWFYQGIENFKGVAVRNIIVKFLFLISIFLFVKDKSDLGIYIFLFSFFTLITNVSFWIKLNNFVKKVNFKSLDIRRHFKPVLLLFIPQVSSLLYTVLDKTMIGMIVPEIKDVNFYEQASYIDKTVLMLIITIGAVMASRMAQEFVNNNKKKMKEYMFEIVNFVWLFGSALMFGVSAVIRNFVPWFYGPEYNMVISLVYIMSPLIIIIGLNNVIGIQYLIPTKRQNKYILAIVIGAIVNIIVNIVLLNTIGTFGAAFSSVIAETIILLVELSYVKDIILLSDILKIGFKYIIYGFIMFIITSISGNIFGPTIFGFLFQLLIGVISYSLILFIVKDRFVNTYIINYLKKFRK
ncbi:MAG: oligosaccharide flippase family protein [Bacilli bacterium]|nr:oligosaccharide flippase family protein [Bacilli bacterium]